MDSNNFQEGKVTGLHAWVCEGQGQGQESGSQHDQLAVPLMTANESTFVLSRLSP